MAELKFKGKSFVQNHHLLVKYHQLVPRPDQSLTDKVSLHDNLIIHGDNLKALKALLPMYAGKVKCIYIDPPYNTGNENWVYNDNVNSPMMQDWLGKVVDREDLTRHDKWLCMMMPRLKLLRELLTDDGAIFVSIDDNEVHHLRVLMDQIFGDENFVATIIWQKVYSPKSSAKHFSEDHDYIVVYARNADAWHPNLIPRTEEQDLRYKNPDKDPRGPWKTSDLSARNPYSAGTYAITCPSGRVIKGPPKGMYWRVSEQKFAEMAKDNRIWWGKKGDSIPQIKRFLSEVKQGRVPQTLWKYRDVGHTQDAKKELISLVQFETSEDVLVTVKPSSLIARILQVASDENSIVLDSFSGSGVTAQAVIQQNAEDGGTRRFILIECEDYAERITAERVRRVIQGVPNAKDQKLRQGLGGSFSYFDLGPPIEMESILSGDSLPTYEDLARYVFYTATGEEFDDSVLDEATHFIGESKDHLVYLFYKPDLDYLKATALTLDRAKALGPFRNKRRLVFAPTKYLDPEHLDELRIDFAQLPFEIYQLVK
jgi:adenine-specific DNA-methyltransferase